MIFHDFLSPLAVAFVFNEIIEIETGTLGWRTFSKKEWTENADFQ